MSSFTKNILLIEDEKKVSKFIKQGLEGEGFSVETAFNGEEGYIKAMEVSHQLIILDVMLPKMDGFEVLEKLRKHRKVIPVLMLTAKDTLNDKIIGLNLGADDYLTKPFAFEELLARIHSLLRRGDIKNILLEVTDLSLDTMTHKANRNGQNIELTSKEYVLLEFFMRNKNKTITREIINEKIWNRNFNAKTNVVDVYVNHLRQKIDGNFKKKLIHTVRGSGYIMKEDNK
jgi:DNA-binding response OmpR family regulator